jgi:hypothetical protein
VEKESPENQWSSVTNTIVIDNAELKSRNEAGNASSGQSETEGLAKD